MFQKARQSFTVKFKLKTENSTLVFGRRHHRVTQLFRLEADHNVVGEKAKQIDLYLMRNFPFPGCGHCKSTKPEFVRAAEKFADELMVAFGAVDCTSDQELCANYDVKGYPTIKYLSYYDKVVKEYTGGRKVIIKPILARLFLYSP